MTSHRDMVPMACTPQGTAKKPPPVPGYTPLQVSREHGDVVLRDTVSGQYWWIGGWLD